MEINKEELVQSGNKHYWPHMIQWSGEIFTESEGCRVKDINGKWYLEARAGYSGVNAGFARKEIAKATQSQLSKINFAPVGGTTIPTINLAAKLASIVPVSQARPFFVSGGSEANDTALKIAREYHNRSDSPKKYKIIARRKSFHGGTFLGTSLDGTGQMRRWVFEPLLPGIIHIAPPYCYRCSYNLRYPDCELFCVKQLEELIQFEGPETISALIGEPVAMYCAGAIPPPEYWPEIRRICTEYNILFIGDEVITGFGRTGKMFGIEHWDIAPDIMTVAKGLTSLHVPMAATIPKGDIADKFIGEGKLNLPHIISYGGNPVSCAAALANLEIIEGEKLVDNSAKMGKYLLDNLESLVKYSLVGEIRGLGLTVFIEIVKDRKTREPFQPEDDIPRKYYSKCRQKGMISQMFGPLAIGLTPPLTIKQGEVDEILNIIDEVLFEIEKESLSK